MLVVTIEIHEVFRRFMCNFFFFFYVRFKERERDREREGGKANTV